MSFCGAILLFCTALACRWRVAVSLDTVGELICGIMDPGSRLPHPEFCNVYIMCTNHSAAQLSCENGILYNPETEMCDPEYQLCPGGLIRNQDGTTEEYQTVQLEQTEDSRKTTKKISDASSKAPTTTTGGSSFTTPTAFISAWTSSTAPESAQPATCPQQDSENLLLLGHPSKCSVYFVCYHGRPVLMECSLGLYWSERNYKCVPRELSECHARSASPYPGCPPEGIDFLPDDRNCHHFWYCRDGFRTLQQCDAFFQWDVNERRCKRATQAVCYIDLLQSSMPTASI